MSLQLGHPTEHSLSVFGGTSLVPSNSRYDKIAANEIRKKSNIAFSSVISVLQHGFTRDLAITATVLLAGGSQRLSVTVMSW